MRRLVHQQIDATQTQELTGNDLSRTARLRVQQGEVSWKQNSVFTEEPSEELVSHAIAEARSYLALSGCCSFNHRMLSV